MPSNSNSLDRSFLPEEPIHPQGADFLEKVNGMLDGQPKDPVAVEAALGEWDGLLEKIAGELYRISSMLIGEGEESIRLIEQVVATVDLPACHDPIEARHNSRLALAGLAIAQLAARDESALTAPADDGSSPVSCIEDDDLDAAGVSRAEFEQMMNGPDSHRLRDWLEGLSVQLRAVFVLRAVAGLTSPEVAGLLAENGGAAAQDWTPGAVRSSFRQALCSLASQLIHATATR